MIQPGVVWGLAAAASWGTADFAGGLAARRAAPVAVTAASQVVGLLLLLVVVLIVRPAAPALDALWLGAVAGLAGGLGLAFLYQALSLGAMGLVAAVSGAGAAIIPLIVTLLLGVGLAPIQVAGVACAVAAGLAAADISRDTASRTALLLALGAAVGFGSWYVLLDRAAEQDAVWALVASRTAASVLTVAILAATRARNSIPALPGLLPLIAVAGVLDAGANAFFVLSRDAISVALAAPLSGLYPLATMALARVVLGERLPRLGVVSVVLAVTGIVLIALG